MEPTTITSNGPQLDRSSDARALGILLRAILAYAQGSVHLTNQAESGLDSKRDFIAEARVVHDVLLRCFQLVHNLSESTSGQFDEGDHGADGALSPSKESMVELWEILRDATNLIEAMIAAPPVTLLAFTSFTNVFERESGSSVAARQFTSAVMPGATPLHPRLSSLGEQISKEPNETDLYSVLSTLFLQLEFLAFIETSMKDRRSLKPLLAVLMLINADTTALLEHLEKRTLKSSSPQTPFTETLDGSAYAIGMEVRKAFEHELAGVLLERQPHHVYAKLENAHGLLRDCFQQSIVSLAQLFEPDLQGTQLFTSFQTKLDQSIALRNEIWRLLRNIKRVLETKSEQTSTILEAVSLFRENSLRFLMYKDRESIERFFEEIEATDGKPELIHVLHRFEAYLQMLLTQVNMRAVLMNYPFESPETP
jgi:hypothetical protein